MADKQLPSGLQGQLGDMWRRVYQQARAIAEQEMAKVLGTVIQGGKVLAAALPIASASALGGIKVGTGLTIAGDGTLSTGGGGGLYAAYVCCQDQKTQNTAGGTFTNAAWRTRTLTTKVADTGSHCTLASNQMTLDAGTYRVLATAPCAFVDKNQLRLQNITDGTTLVTGTSIEFISANNGEGMAGLEGRFTLAASKVVELQHQCQTTRATDGLGRPANFTTEIYATVELWKEA